jgi:hypothetical protein
MDLLECPELEQTINEKSVKKAIRAWIPSGQGFEGLGTKMR